MNLEFLKENIHFTEKEVIFDRKFYETIMMPSMDNALLLKQTLQELVFYLNHLRTTKAIYNQIEVANYIEHMIINFK